MIHKIQKAHHYPEIGVPFFWPLGIALDMGKKALDLEQHNVNFLKAVIVTEGEKPKPKWSSPNTQMYSLHTFTLRDFSVKNNANDIPLLIIPPYAGHTSVIADFHKGQSLVESFHQNCINRVFVIDWHSATLEMKDYDIDNYLEELSVAIKDLGGRVHLVGLCQGGWMASLYAARFPHQVASLVVAGSPIDTQGGKGAIKENANKLPISFFEKLVATGGGLLKGEYMLQGFKNLHPQEQYIDKYIELYEHIDDPHYLKRTKNFERWYEYTINLPGRWYLQVIQDLFKDNLFVKDKFVALGKTISPKSITCPVYLLAGDKDDITAKEQVFNAAKYLGTPPSLIIKDLATGGHIGLFMGNTALIQNWPKIASWLKGQR